MRNLMEWIPALAGTTGISRIMPREVIARNRAKPQSVDNVRAGYEKVGRGDASPLQATGLRLKPDGVYGRIGRRGDRPYNSNPPLSADWGRSQDVIA